MNENIEQLLASVAAANDKLMEVNSVISTTIGLLEQSLQDSNAVTVDNAKLKKRLMFIILDAHPDIVGIGIGKTGSDEFDFIAQQPLAETSTTFILQLMQQHLDE